jgi:hypothetical protein
MGGSDGAAHFFSETIWLRHMPRKPNYRFERNEREKAKAAKKAAKSEAKAQKKSDEAEGEASAAPLAHVEGSDD